MVEEGNSGEGFSLLKPGCEGKLAEQITCQPDFSPPFKKSESRFAKNTFSSCCSFWLETTISRSLAFLGRQLAALNSSTLWRRLVRIRANRKAHTSSSTNSETAVVWPALGTTRKMYLLGVHLADHKLVRVSFVVLLVKDDDNGGYAAFCRTFADSFPGSLYRPSDLLLFADRTDKLLRHLV